MKLKRWDKDKPPTIQGLGSALKGEGLDYYRWSDKPGVTYPWHTHPYAEVRWVVSGSIKIGLRGGKEVVLKAGDRIDLPANTEHWAEVVSREPVVYLCASKDDSA